MNITILHSATICLGVTLADDTSLAPIIVLIDSVGALQAARFANSCGSVPATECCMLMAPALLLIRRWLHTRIRQGRYLPRGGIIAGRAQAIWGWRRWGLASAHSDLLQGCHKSGRVISGQTCAHRYFMSQFFAAVRFRPPQFPRLTHLAHPQFDTTSSGQAPSLSRQCYACLILCLNRSCHRDYRLSSAEPHGIGSALDAGSREEWS